MYIKNHLELGPLGVGKSVCGTTVVVCVGVHTHGCTVVVGVDGATVVGADGSTVVVVLLLHGVTVDGDGVVVSAVGQVGLPFVVPVGVGYTLVEPVGFELPLVVPVGVGVTVVELEPVGFELPLVVPVGGYTVVEPVVEDPSLVVPVGGADVDVGLLVDDDPQFASAGQSQT